MRYYTREWYELSQTENRLRYLKKLPPGTWGDREIRALYRRELEAYVRMQREDWEAWAAQQSEELRKEWPFDPAEAAEWFRSDYRGGCRFAGEIYPAWLTERVDKRLLAMRYVPSELWPRLQTELRKAQRKLKSMEEAIRDHAAREERTIPEKVSQGFRLHDAMLLSLRRKGSEVSFLFNNGGVVEDLGRPYQRLAFRGVSLFEREPGIVLRPRLRDNTASPVRIEGGPESEWTSDWSLIYRELYRTEEGYEIRMMLRGRNRIRYITLRCREIGIEYGAEPESA